MFTILPSGYRTLGVLDHHLAVRADPLPVKCGLRQTPLAPPEITLARHQTIAHQSMEKRRAQRLSLAKALSVRHQERLDVVRVVKKVSVDPEETCANNV